MFLFLVSDFLEPDKLRAPDFGGAGLPLTLTSWGRLESVSLKSASLLFAWFTALHGSKWCLMLHGMDFFALNPRPSVSC